MKKAEQLQLKQSIQDAAAHLQVVHPKIRERVQRHAARFSPTSLERFRDMAEIVWWLVAVDARSDAMRILDALCTLNGQSYWMFQSLASVFATRAWLHSQRDDAARSMSDARTAREWIEREPNRKPITREEVESQLQAFDTWLRRADEESGVVTAARVLAHALRVLIVYQQLACSGCKIAQSVDTEIYSARIDQALTKLRERLLAW